MSNISWSDVSPYFPYHDFITRPLCCFSALKASANKVVVLCLQKKHPEILTGFSVVPFFWSIRTIRSSNDPAALCKQVATPSEAEWAQEIKWLEEVRIQ